MASHLPVQFNPGPPFAIGAIVLCDSEEFGKRWGLVMRSDHPFYLIHLDNDQVIDNSVTSVILVPSYADWEGNTNDFVQYVEPPLLKKLRSEMNQAGSYGVYIDSQNTALKCIEEAKAYAKAVKADDAGIPVALWNDRIVVSGIQPEAIDVALRAFC